MQPTAAAASAALRVVRSDLYAASDEQIALFKAAQANNMLIDSTGTWTNAVATACPDELTSDTFTPIVAGILILLLPAHRKNEARGVALAAATFALILSIWAYFHYDQAAGLRRMLAGPKPRVFRGIDPDSISPAETYSLLVSCVIPRPIAFVSTTSL